MENMNRIWIFIIILALYVFKMLWDKRRKKFPVILRRIICFIAYGAAIYVYIFCYEDWFIKMLGLIFVPLATCILLFGKRKEWSSFKDFLIDFYESDGLFFMSIIVIGFWIMFMI